MLARRPHARAIRPATVGVVCADFSQATLSPTRKHKQERMMRFEVSGTLVIKFPSVLEGFQSDKQLPSLPPPRSAGDALHTSESATFSNIRACSARWLRPGCGVRKDPADWIRSISAEAR